MTNEKKSDVQKEFMVVDRDRLEKTTGLEISKNSYGVAPPPRPRETSEDTSGGKKQEKK